MGTGLLEKRPGEDPAHNLHPDCCPWLLLASDHCVNLLWPCSNGIICTISLASFQKLILIFHAF
ncbi:hypothetical protein GJAV_G00251470 [Gymnothorax javanicus]|nr:hypothetical protein GJAV_G00251470 [Gymnothorax javanicus]